jgi:hypothetical protein
MLTEQRGPAPDGDDVLLLVLGAHTFARRLRSWIEREAPADPGAEGSEVVDTRGADARIPPELAAWLGVLALGDRLNAWLDRTRPPEPSEGAAADGAPSATLDLLR